jgi:hypothetical protein
VTVVLLGNLLQLVSGFRVIVDHHLAEPFDVGAGGTLSGNAPKVHFRIPGVGQVLHERPIAPADRRIDLLTGRADSAVVRRRRCVVSSVAVAGDRQHGRTRQCHQSCRSHLTSSSSDTTPSFLLQMP